MECCSLAFQRPCNVKLHTHHVEGCEFILPVRETNIAKLQVFLNAFAKGLAKCCQ